MAQASLIGKVGSVRCDGLGQHRKCKELRFVPREWLSAKVAERMQRTSLEVRLQFMILYDCRMTLTLDIRDKSLAVAGALATRQRAGATRLINDLSDAGLATGTVHADEEAVGLDLGFSKLTESSKFTLLESHAR